jgi:hypothetical protein
MYVRAGQRQGIRGAFQAILEFVLSKVLSRHGKRILFITSLYFQVVQIERLKADAIQKLNSIMKLAHAEEALQLPVAMRGMVWNSTAIQDTLTAELMDQDITDERANEISEKVVSMAPPWLRYGSRDMVKDVVDLIRNGSQLAAAA